MTEIFSHEIGQPICFTEVTLRDGLQQDDIADRWMGEPVPIEERMRVFDAIVDSGIKRIEIGHLGNEEGNDVAFAREVVNRIITTEASGDDRYDDVELQVLFGSQKSLIARGVEALDGISKDRVIVHVYDRVSEQLRNLATEPYDSAASAQRVIEAAQIALDNGFTRLSISGEGAIDPTTPLEEVIEFYATVTDELRKRGATEVNWNLANTFGFSLGDETEAELFEFNQAAKTGRDYVTTSAHVHNDYNDAPGYAIAAIRAGFDRIEGTWSGMGERCGNVAIADVVVRLLENARTNIDRMQAGTVARKLGSYGVRESIWKQRYLEPSVVAALGKAYKTCVTISEIFGTDDRFRKTSLGNPAAYDAGSGPHAHANQEFLRDPVGKPLWRNYGSSALIHAMLGRPEAQEVIDVDPDRIRKITLRTHAAGGSTNRVLANEISIASPEERKRSTEMANELMEKIAIHIGKATLTD